MKPTLNEVEPCSECDNDTNTTCDVCGDNICEVCIDNHMEEYHGSGGDEY
jgi:hypothetical protein